MGFDIDRLTDFFKTQKEFIPALVNHLKSSYIVDLIKAFVKPDNGPKRAEILDWLFSGGFFDQVISQLSPFSDSNAQDNASDVLLALLNACGEVSLKVRPYESKETVDKVFYVMFDRDNNHKPTSSFIRGLEVLTGIMAILESSQKSSPSDPPPTHPTFLLIIPHLEKFKGILNSPPKTRVGSFGEIAVAGEVALSVLRFLLALVRPRSVEVDHKLIELDVLTDCIHMFFQYVFIPWFNFFGLMF
jgi:hypothetical protein